MKLFMWKNLVVGLFVSSLLCSCMQKQETLTPLYGTEELKIKDANIKIWTTLNPDSIQPSGLRQAVRDIFGWIPLVGQIMELPIDFGRALIPPLDSTSNPELPKDADWKNPEVLKALRSVTIGVAYLRITPKAKRVNYPSKCLQDDCDETEFNEFLEEVKVYVQFKNPKAEALRDNPELSDTAEMLLAGSKISENYDVKTKVLYFDVEGKNLRPYLLNYNDFDVKIVANGKYPKYPVYYDGKIRLDLVLKLTKDPVQKN